MAFFTRDFPEATKLYTELMTADPEGGSGSYGSLSYQSALGCLLIASGETERGRAQLQASKDSELKKKAVTPQHPQVLYRLAAIDASLGEINSALEHLAGAAEAGWIDFRSLSLDPRFDALREQSAYREIYEKMKRRVAALPRPAFAVDNSETKGRTNK